MVGQLIRFCAVGTLTAILYFGGATALHQYARLPVAVAACVSFLFVIGTNYTLHHRWTFGSRRQHRSSVPRFLGTAAGGLFINYEVVALGSHWLPLSQPAVLLSGAVFVIAWNYMLARFWVFVDPVQYR